MAEPDFDKAVRTITKHVEGARGDVSERALNAALVRVLPSLQDIAEVNKAQDRYTRRVFGKAEGGL